MAAGFSVASQGGGSGDGAAPLYYPGLDSSKKSRNHLASSAGDSPFNYVAYIDEAGDPGLKTVRPIDPNGSSEWLVLGAYVVRAENLPLTEQLHEKMLDRLKSQKGEIHYRNLSASRKLVAARMLASVPARALVVASNKKNMRHYRNRRAEKIRSQDWFYNWCLRLLIERITELCVVDAKQREVPPTCKLVFSERGSFDYAQMDAYHSYMRFKGDHLYRTGGSVRWEAIGASPFEVKNHAEIAGLQFADIIASGFYDAADTLRPRGNNPAPALALSPIIARRGKFPARFGVALFPSDLEKAELSLEQQTIFNAYGYSFLRSDCRRARSGQDTPSALRP